MAHRDESKGPCGGTCGPGARQTRPSALPPGKAGFTSRLSTARAWRSGTVIVPQGWSGPGVLQAARRAALLGGTRAEAAAMSPPKRRRAGAARPLEVEL